MLKKEILEKKVPENELKIIPIRCSGPGGQNINKGTMGREIRWSPQDSSVFSEREKDLICKKLKVSQSGEIIVSATDRKSAEQNRKNGIERLNKKVIKALEVEEERIPTKKSKAVKKREHEARMRHSKKKESRQKIKDY